MYLRSCAFNSDAQIVILMWCWPVISQIIEYYADDSSYCVVCYVLRDLRELWIMLAQLILGRDLLLLFARISIAKIVRFLLYAFL